MVDNPETPKSRSPLRILAVEDSDFLRQVFETAFREEHLVETAPDAKSGWAAYLSHRPDVIFLDILLPDGNGHDLAFRIKEHNRAAFVVMATASDYADDLQEASFNHVDGFITKPFDKQQINDLIEKYWVTREKK